MDIIKQIQDIMMASLYKTEELEDKSKPPEDAIIVHGITQRFGFHPERIKEQRPAIKKLLDEMPIEFHRKHGGGGWSFLQLCLDKNGNHWGEHINMQDLCVLAIGSGLGEWCFPREIWPALPGGVPYVMFDTESA